MGLYACLAFVELKDVCSLIDFTFNCNRELEVFIERSLFLSKLNLICFPFCKA